MVVSQTQENINIKGYQNHIIGTKAVAGITHYGKLSNTWFSTIIQIFVMVGQICPVRSLYNPGSPEQQGLRLFTLHNPGLNKPTNSSVYAGIVF